MNKLGIVAGAIVAFALSQTASFGAETAWPTKPITLVVPFAPGGNNDLLARTIAPKLGEKLGKPVIVENRPGAGGTLATSEVAVAPHDGYRMMLGDISTHAIGPSIYKDLTYDPIKGFAPVIQLTSVSLFLVANPDFPAKTVQELVAFAKTNPGRLSFASSGNGSPQHLAFEYLKSLTGMTAVHIPFNGSAPAITNLIGGHVPVMIDGTAVPHIKSGALRALAVTGAQRSATLPDVPTVAESGVPGFVFTSWHGVFFPAGVAPEIVQRVNGAVNEILKDPAIKARFAELNIDLVGGTAEHFADFVRSEAEKMAKLVEISGARN